LKEKYGKVYIDFFENPFDHPVPGEGSFQNAMDRALEGFEALAERHKGQNVAIVSHGGLLRVMLVGLLGMGDEFYRKTWMTNTSVTMVDVMEDGRKLLMTLNDKAHLEMAELFEKGEEK
ncbi:MAG: histidine phosphatase family protein, partial [Firmicutes bacterium]|nr:histidine phosphatase family protein [Bacillota bacterium]